MPTLPTDSFYKFLFVSGLVIIVFTSYVKYNFTITAMKSENKVDSLFHNGEIYFMIDSIKTEYLKTDLKFGVVPFPDAKKRFSALQDSTISQAINMKKIGYAKQERDNLSKMIDSTDVLIYCYLGLGFLLMIGGSISWLILVQIPQDRILLMQVLMAEIELRKANEKPYRKQVQPQVQSKLNFFKLYK